MVAEPGTARALLPHVGAGFASKMENVGFRCTFIAKPGTNLKA